jgi:hypothetical protein
LKLVQLIRSLRPRSFAGKIRSGRTKDENIGHVAEYLAALGIDPKGVRAVGDEEGPRLPAQGDLDWGRSSPN